VREIRWGLELGKSRLGCGEWEGIGDGRYGLWRREGGAWMKKGCAYLS